MPPSKELTRAKKVIEGTTRMSVSPATSSTEDTPAYTSPESAALLQAMRPCVDLEKGVAHIRSLKEVYLPKGPAEGTDDYKRRVHTSELYNMHNRTQKGLAGMPFRRNPIVSPELDKEVQEHLKNVDLADTPLSVYAKETFERGLARGHVATLVDFFSAPANRNLRTETQEGLRPYWVKVYPENIKSWRLTNWNGHTMLQQIALEFETTKEVGRFSSRCAKEWRVFRWHPRTASTPAWVEFELWEEGVKGPVFVRNGLVSNQERIPLAVSYLGSKLGVLMSQPATLDVAYTTISHYQVLSDHRYSLHKASVPLLAAFGRPDPNAELVVGVNQVLDIPTGGDLRYVEHTGSALGASRQELKDIETRCAAQGLSMLQSETRSAETAEAKRIDKAEQDSALAAATFSHQLMLQQSVGYHCNFMKRPIPKEDAVKLNTDFQELSYDAGMVGALQALRVANDISLDTFWDLLQSGNILPQTFDRDLEKVRLEDARKQDLALMVDTQKIMAPAEKPAESTGEPPQSNEPPAS